MSDGCGTALPGAGGGRGVEDNPFLKRSSAVTEYHGLRVAVPGESGQHPLKGPQPGPGGRVDLGSQSCGQCRVAPGMPPLCCPILIPWERKGGACRVLGTPGVRSQLGTPAGGLGRARTRLAPDLFGSVSPSMSFPSPPGFVHSGSKGMLGQAAGLPRVRTWG